MRHVVVSLLSLGPALPLLPCVPRCGLYKLVAPLPLLLELLSFFVSSFYPLLVSVRRASPRATPRAGFVWTSEGRRGLGLGPGPGICFCTLEFPVPVFSQRLCVVLRTCVSNLRLLLFVTTTDVKD